MEQAGARCTGGHYPTAPHMRSPKTTIAGATAALGAALIAYAEIEQSSPLAELIGAAFLVAGLLMQGCTARDDDTTSEGGKIPKGQR